MLYCIPQKKGKWYIVSSHKNSDGKWQTKWHKTGLDIKGNKKRAEAMAKEMEKEYARGIDIDNKLYVDEFVKSWYYGVVKNSVEITTWEG